MANNLLDKEYDEIHEQVEVHLSAQPSVSVSVDGWENQKGDPIKMVNLLDGSGHAFLTQMVDDPGMIADAKSYKAAVDPALARENCVGVVSDGGSNIKKMRDSYAAEPQHSGKEIVHCAWHAIDNAAPFTVVPPFVSAISLAKQINTFFRYMHVAKGRLLKKREERNKLARGSVALGLKSAAGSNYEGAYACMSCHKFTSPTLHLSLF